MTLQRIDALDYRDSMQLAAQGYLQRHEASYLADSDLLFNNCVYHLVTSLDVPVFLAQTLVQRAWDELFRHHEPACLGVDWSQGDSGTAHLTDVDGLRYPVPAHLLPPHLLDRRPKHP
ncbi:MAG: hypothetical protein GAK45_00110 [Pseudomonas citronellolis]|nr:MAG: hypothetical protein GAK45_00110 [Pseudomonas citronellolis]